MTTTSRSAFLERTLLGKVLLFVAVSAVLFSVIARLTQPLDAEIRHRFLPPILSQGLLIACQDVGEGVYSCHRVPTEKWP